MDSSLGQYIFLAAYKTHRSWLLISLILLSVHEVKVKVSINKEYTKQQKGKVAPSFCVVAVKVTGYELYWGSYTCRLSWPRFSVPQGKCLDHTWWNQVLAATILFWKLYLPKYWDLKLATKYRNIKLKYLYTRNHTV